MTSKANLSEAEKADLAFDLALSRSGALTAIEALALWNTLSSTPSNQAAASWLSKAISAAKTRRLETRALAMAYYRLTRALRTGKTIPSLDGPDVTHVSLMELREDFRKATGQPEPVQESPTQAPPSDDTSTRSEDPGADSGDDDNDRILVEEIARLKEDAEAREKAIERELEIDLQALGIDKLNKLNKQIDTSQPATEVDALRKQAHARAGSQQAAAAARIGMNGGRDTIHALSDKDSRVLGYVRASRTGTPCGWCAMLISRGPVYRSKNAAEYAEGKLYHDNCKCYPIPVYSDEQYDSDPKFDLNREYSKQWPVVTRGLSGKAAVSAWRRFIRQQQKAAPVAA